MTTTQPPAQHADAGQQSHTDVTAQPAGPGQAPNAEQTAEDFWDKDRLSSAPDTNPSYAMRRDALLQVAIDFMANLTGMTPPPIEVAPPEIFAPFREFVLRVEKVIDTHAALAGQSTTASTPTPRERKIMAEEFIAPSLSDWLRNASLCMWLACGERGQSSNSIVQHLTGVPAAGHQYRGHGIEHPYDPDDLDRCLKLLRDVPILRVMLPGMRTASPSWAALIDRWEEVERCHLDEVGLGWTKARSAPKTYALMCEILHAVRHSAKKSNTQGGTE